MADKIVLPASEQKLIAKGVIDFLNTNCPYIPDSIIVEYQGLEGNSGISLHTLKGAVKKNVYVDGGYTGYYPFAIYYRTLPDSTPTRLDASDVVDSIGNWLSTCEELDAPIDYPEIGNCRLIESIEQVTNATLVNRNEDGIEDYMATFDLLYSKE